MKCLLCSHNGVIHVVLAAARNQRPRSGRERIHALDPLASGGVVPFTANQHLVFFHIKPEENIRQISKLDESCISNPRSEISNWTRDVRRLSQSDLIFRISDSRCRIRPISKCSLDATISEPQE